MRAPVAGAILRLLLGQAAPDEPWEAEDLASTRGEAVEKPPVPPVEGAFVALIGRYQQSHSANSSHRCLFRVSCSHFAAEALVSYGLFGLVPFVDRFFFRENGAAYGRYPAHLDGAGILLLDDDGP